MKTLNDFRIRLENFLSRYKSTFDIECNIENTEYFLLLGFESNYPSKFKLYIKDKKTNKKYLINLQNENTGVLSDDPYPYIEYYIDITSIREIIEISKKDSMSFSDKNIMKINSKYYVCLSAYKKFIKTKNKLDKIKQQLELCL